MMRPLPASLSAASVGPSADPTTGRGYSLRNVGEALRLYEELERALAQWDRETHARFVVDGTKSAHALFVWTRRVAQLRDLNRRFH